MNSVSLTTTTWNFSPLFASDNDPALEAEKKLLEQKAQAFIETWKNREDYVTDPAVLAEALTQYEVWSRTFGIGGKQAWYFSLRTAQDQNNPELKAKTNKIVDLENDLQNRMQFFLHRVAKIKSEDQVKFLDYAGLAPFRHFLERLFAEAKYLLTEDQEALMNLKYMSSHYNWVQMVSGFLAKESGDVQVSDTQGYTSQTKTFAEIMSLLNHKDQTTRDSAAQALNSILAKHVEVAEAEINSILGNKKVDDELRGFSRPDQSRHLSDDVDSATVDTMLETVSGHFDLAQRYYALKARLFGKEKLAYHERNVEYGEIKGTFDFQTSLDLVYAVFAKLDPQFATILESFAANGQFDVFPYPNKDSGAFCSAYKPQLPTYVFLNHTDRLNDVLTLAHEMGHAINSEFMKQKVHSLDYDFGLLLAESPSTFMEDFVLEEILRQSDEEQQLALLMQKLNDDISTIFRQVACYRFEQDLHAQYREKGYLAHADIGEIFKKHMGSYMGPSVEQSEGCGNWWVYWSHIRNFFYVYSYASGLLISKFMQKHVKEDPTFIAKVKEFFSAGLSASPVNILADLGIDLHSSQVWNDGIEEVAQLLDQTEALAKKLGKLKD
jgi:oligoendopeptidase F